MKTRKAIILSLFICIVFFLSINMKSSNLIKNSLDNRLENKEVFQFEDLNNATPKSSAALIAKDAYAIVVGISDYPGTSADLSYCDDDSQDIYSMLINDFNFKSENVYYFQDSSASKAAISNAFDLIASQISEDDIFFFYYSGHGGAGTSSAGIQSHSIDSPHYYSNNYDNMWSIYHSDAAYMRVHFDRFDLEYDYDYVYLGDTDLGSGWYYDGYTGSSSGFWSVYIPLLSDNRLYIRMITDSSITDWGFSIDSYEAEMYDGTHFLSSYDSIPNTPSNYYMDFLLDSKLDQIDCDEKYIVLDACNTGGMIPEVQEIGRYIMTACQDNESSIEDPSLQHGVFTNFFLESFDSATDSNADGVISLEESFPYTSSNTISYSSGMGYIHHPQQYDGISGETVLFTSFGALTLTPSGNSLSYSFHMYGTGLIEDLRIAACNISETITYAVEDLTENPASNTGFGYYSGTIQLNGVTGITDYCIFARINGRDVIFLNQTVSNDTDSDSIDDIIEIMFGMNISDNDSDSDGLDDYIEFFGATDPISSDTDNDGLLDGEEVLIYFTDPTNADTDGDGYSDGIEVQWGTDPLDPKISLNTVFFNIAGIAILASSSYFIVRTTLTNKKQKTKTKPIKDKLKIVKKPNVYNAIKVEKKFKPKPKPSPYPRSSYAQSYSRPSYTQTRPRYGSNNVEFKKIIDLILYGLPPPKSIYSVEGKKAQNIANYAFRDIEQGRFSDGFNNMINALILGVPEPMNSRIKTILLKSLSQFSSDSQSSTAIQKSSDSKKCSWCGKENKISNKFCINCGRGL